MISGVNKVILVGNVGYIETRETVNGKKIINLSVATSESWNDKVSGERKSKTEWHRVVIFVTGLVNIVEQYVKKGTKLYIEGALQTRKWRDNTGVDKHITEIVLQGYNCSLIILDSKKANANNNEYHNSSSSSSNREISNDVEYLQNSDMNDDIDARDSDDDNYPF